MDRRAMTAAIVAAAAIVATGFHADAQDDPTTALTARLIAQIEAHPLLSTEVKAFAIGTLAPLCTDATLVRETAKQNAAKATLESIKAIDDQWINAEEQLPIHREKLGNACAERLKVVAKDNPRIFEAFAMDNQGAVVGVNRLTSDYWQGDEAKWQNSFLQGKGGIDVGKPAFDRSADRTLLQISLPLIDRAGKVIGAVTYGVTP